jgi:hypothetical protein
MKSLSVIQDNEGSSEDIDRADRSIQILELGPVLILSRSSRREIKDVTDNGKRLGTRREVKSSLLLREENIIHDKCS